jgi:hypothetical protein
MARALAASSFARTLHKSLMADAEQELELALRVAYGLEAGLSADDIAARLGVDRGEVLAAAKQVERSRQRLRQGTHSPPEARIGARIRPGGAGLQGKDRVGARSSTRSSTAGGPRE